MPSTPIRFENGKLIVPDHPVIPFIEGDGIGIDITPVTQNILNKAVELAYGDKRSLEWHEIYAGQKAKDKCGEWLPEKTFKDIGKYKVAIKGPLTTPVGEGITSLNVAIRQRLDLFACVRPVRYFPGTPTPLRSSSTTDMIVFRENTEDIYAGIEWPAETDDVRKVIAFLQDEMDVSNIRFPKTSGIGIKPVSKEGSMRLIRMAIQYALDNKRRSVSLVHKGNIMKYTEGAFRNWGYEVAENEFNAKPIDGGPWCSIKTPDGELVIKDVIADNFMQQILLKPHDYDVIATLNLNGDYISDALAAQVGGIGIAPGANISNELAVFEATHGSAPKYAGKNRVNPGSMILSGEMMLRHLGWNEAADLVIHGMAAAIAAKTVTYDLARARGGMIAGSLTPSSQKAVADDLQRLMPGATLVTTSGFGDAVVAHMENPQ